MSRARTRAPQADRQAIWSAIRACASRGESVSAPLLRGELRGSCPLGRIRDYLHCLEAAGIVAREPAETVPVGAPVQYRLCDDRGAEAPRVRADGTEVAPSARERLWTALRVARRATLRELLAAASGPGQVISLATAEDYFGRLERAGRVVSVPKGRPDARVLYLPRQLDTGPLAPVIRQGRQRAQCLVEDPNTGLAYDMTGAEVTP